MGTQDLSGFSLGISAVSISNTMSTPISTSQQIVEGAENCLRHNSYLALKNVRCDFHEGALILRGCLPTYYLKQVAQQTVSRLEGVDRIVNEIEVVASSRR
jgi:osmotically-inducible protein OsmY